LVLELELVMVLVLDQVLGEVLVLAWGLETVPESAMVKALVLEMESELGSVSGWDSRRYRLVQEWVLVWVQELGQVLDWAWALVWVVRELVQVWVEQGRQACR